MKLSVVCLYYNHNYGSILQSMALNKQLEDMGHEIDVIPFRDAAGSREKLDIMLHLRLKKLFDPAIIKRKLKERRNNSSLSGGDPEYTKGIKLRDAAYSRFIAANFDVGDRELAKSELSGYVEGSDAVIVGSDQLWTPHDILIGYHTLEFVPQNIKRISYATSFGVSELSGNHLKKRTKAFISEMDVVSVREVKGKEIIDNLGTGKKVEVVVDPTMLLSREQWDKLLPRERIVKDKYIFCYFLGNNPEQRALAKKLSSETGLKIVALQHMDEYIPEDRDFADKALYDIDPSQFAALIRDSELILTDSFHSSVFSILYHKPFFVMNRHSSAEVRSTNSRIDTLCSMLGLEDRHLSNVEDCVPRELLSREINYEDVDIRLENERIKSIAFLENALR